MTRLNTLLIILFSTLFIQTTLGQDEAEVEILNREIASLKQRQRQLSSDNSVLFNKVSNLTKAAEKNRLVADSLASRVTRLEEELIAANELLSCQINNTNNSLKQTNGTINKNQHNTILYILISFSGLLLILFIIYFSLKGRQRKDIAMIDEIRKTQDNLMAESLKLDQKLLEYFERETLQPGGNEDHSLALKVADEVVRIEMNLFKMDKNVKGYKQLSKAIERIKNNFSAQGYDIVNLLGTEYNEGMRINADFVIDESLTEGSRIITSVTKPQINYKGKMIQKAIVTVSQNI